MLQLVDAVSLPLHLPATEQLLVRVFVPSPHVRLHVPHESHAPHVAVIFKINIIPINLRIGNEMFVKIPLTTFLIALRW